jgi:hypothetical protein
MRLLESRDARPAAAIATAFAVAATGKVGVLAGGCRLHRQPMMFP